MDKALRKIKWHIKTGEEDSETNSPNYIYISSHMLYSIVVLGANLDPGKMHILLKVC